MPKLSLSINKNRPNSDGEHTIFLQLSAFSQTIRISTEVFVKKEHWMPTEEVIAGGRTGDPLSSSKNMRLSQIFQQCQIKLINNAERVAKMDVQALKKFLLQRDKLSDTNFFRYCALREEHFRALGKEKSADLLMCTASKLKDYWGDTDLDLQDIDVKFLEKFEAFCLRTPKKVHGKKVNTELTKLMTLNGVAVYMRNIRTLFNAAIDDNLTQDYPFKRYKIKTEPTRNRNLSVDDLRRVRDYQSDNKLRQVTAHLFLLQFYLQGINLVDLFWMPHEAVVGGRLQYYRRKTMSKTPRWCNTKIEPEAAEILKRYRGEKYLLWFADYNGSERQEAYHTPHARKSRLQWKDPASFIRTINNHLEEIQKELSINPGAKITGYFVRHSFASILREVGVPIDDINLSMGHRPAAQKITGIYINEDFIRADRANRRLIDHVNRDITPTKVRAPRKAKPPANS